MKFEERLYKEIATWQANEIISASQAEEIRVLYPLRKDSGYNAALVIFSVLGALFIGGGIILMLAINWATLSVATRTIIAFFPLMISQALTAWILIKKIQSAAWREGISVFYCVSVYACVAIIGQLYQFAGNFTNFMLLCSLLILPMPYVLKSTTPMLVYIAGTTIWASSAIWNGSNLFALYFIGLLVAVIPHTWWRFKENLYSVYSQLLMWCLAICGFFAVAFIFPFSGQGFVIISLYFSMLYLISATWIKSEAPIKLRPPQIIGFVGAMIMLFYISGNSALWFLGYRLSFTLEYWPQAIIVLMMAIFTIILLVLNVNWNNPTKSLDSLLIGGIFLIAFALQFILPDAAAGWTARGSVNPLIILFVNLYILGIGIWLIGKGLNSARLSLACLGTFIIAIMTIFRFFDSNLGNLQRGLAFILVGAGFLTANYFISKRIKKGVPSDVEAD